MISDVTRNNARHPRLVFQHQQVKGTIIPLFGSFNQSLIRYLLNCQIEAP